MQDAQKYEEQLAQMTNQLMLIFNDFDTTENRIVRQDAINRAEQMLQRLYKVHRQLKSSLRTEDSIEEHQNVVTRDCVGHLEKIHKLAKEIEERREQISIFHKAVTNSSSINNIIEAMSVYANKNLNHECYDKNSEKMPLMLEQHEESRNEPLFTKNALKMQESESATQLATGVQYIHQKTMFSLNNTERVLNQTEEIGSQAITTLRAQGEQITMTNNTLQGMNSNLQQAKDELKAFVRRVAHDKIVIFLAITIVLCLIVIVLLTIVHHYIH